MAARKPHPHLKIDHEDLQRLADDPNIYCTRNYLMERYGVSNMALYKAYRKLGIVPGPTVWFDRPDYIKHNNNIWLDFLDVREYNKDAAQRNG